jgi:hypothetical protein
MIVIQSYCGDYDPDSGESSYLVAHPPCECCDEPCNSCNELTEIEAEIEDLHFRLKDLHERHRQARTIRNLVHNGPLIHQLPHEIVIDIFNLTSPPHASDCDKPGKEVDPLILTKICRTWRELALSTPSLWSRISVDARKSNFPLLNYQVTHSGEIPLSIHLFALDDDTHDDPSTLSKETMSLIVKQLHRTSSLCINLPVNFITEFSSLSILDCPNATPLLKEFHVHCSDELRSFRLRLAIEPPSPRTMLFEGLPCDQVYLNWTYISHLTLKIVLLEGHFRELLCRRISNIFFWRCGLRISSESKHLLFFHPSKS